MKLQLRSHRMGRAVLAAVLTAGGIVPVAWAGDAAKPVTPMMARQAAAKAVDVAVVNLNKEVAKHKDGKTPLRTKSNYFQENPSPDVTVDAIVTALGRRQGSDGSSDAYIKWQLLSGIDKFDEKLAAQAAGAYRGAPEPIARPGLEPADKRRLDVAVRGAGENDVKEINAKFAADVAEVAAANDLILKYRTEFFGKLPPTADAVAAGFDDCVLRANRGISSDALGKKVMAGIQLWAAGGPPPQQLHAMAGLLRQQIDVMGGMPANKAAAIAPRPEVILAADVQFVAAKPPSNPGAKTPPKPSFPPSYYAAVEYDATSKHLKWTEGSAKFINVKELVDEYRALEEAANHPGPELKFKDGK